MDKITIDDSELESLFGKKNYERRNNRIFVFQNNDIYSHTHGYHKWLRADYAALKVGHKICENGKTGIYNQISVLRSKIENKIPFYKIS